MKKIVTAALVLTLLVALTGASASEAGTTSDPLLTKDYIDNTYLSSLVELGLETIDSALSPFDGVMDIIAEGGETFARTSGREGFVNTAEGSVTLGLGASFLLTSGTANVVFDSGEVIDTSTGEPVASGGALRTLTRYFVTEDTLAVFTPSQNAAFFLDGPYIAGDGIIRQYALYEDVRGTEWYAAVSRYSHDAHLFHDWDAGLYRPLDDASRAEMIFALWVTAGCPETDFVSPFTDLTEEWYIPAVNWAYEHGITNGSGAEDLFDPDGVLRRQQIVTMLYRWSADLGMDVSGQADLSVFPDYESISGWASAGVSWASYVGLIYGYQDGTFHPTSSLSRAEAATILQRYEPLLAPLTAAEPETYD